MLIDRIFSRYGSAEMLLDSYIGTGRLCMFLDKFIDICNEEQAFEVWMHKVHNKTFGEFLSEVLPPKHTEPVKEADVAAIVKNSMDILDKFNPQEVREN